MVARPPVILFADHDLSWSRDVRVKLRRCGAEVMMASSAPQALERASHCVPDVLVLDDGLGDAGGPEIVDVFQQALPETQIILLKSDATEVPRASGRGLFYCGPRPIAPDLVLGLVRTVLRDRLVIIPQDSGTPHGFVVVVDDDPSFLRSVSRFLSRHGYRVEGFQSAESALWAVPELKPDLVIVDLMMPGIGGLELAQGIRESTAGGTPVVVLTALDSEEACYESHEHGACYMMAKSEKPQKVLDVVDYLAGDLDDSERELLKSQL